MIKWHPDTATLAAYAAGTLSDGMTLLVSGHLTLCPHCRDRVSAMEAVGGSLIQETAPVAIGGGALAAVMDRIGAIEEEDEEEPVIARAFPRDTPLPRPIQHAVGSDLDTLNWQFRLPGLHEYTLPGFDGEDVSLIRARPGAQMLSHTHKGEEATLVLTGAMQDGDHLFRKGDVAQADHSHDHKPSIVGEETCYCLIVMSGGMEFTGRLGRALNILNR